MNAGNLVLGVTFPLFLLKNRLGDRLTDVSWSTVKEGVRQTERQTDGLTERQTDIQKDKQMS